jgi:hypothetical protein
MLLREEEQERLKYLFGHLVDSYHTENAHASDSGELAQDEMTNLDLTQREKQIIDTIAGEVAGNYRYTGETNKIVDKIMRSEL